jgi:SSS family solute:Na+ symporter
MRPHFFWIGAIPAMVFSGIFMMPFYYGSSKTHSVPGFLRLRFNEATRGFNAITFAFITVHPSGVNMYAMAIVFRLLLGWSLNLSLLVSSLVLVLYLALGGLTAAIYNEVLQFFLTMLGLLPLTILGLRDVGGWSGLKEQVNDPQFFHLWAIRAARTIPWASPSSRYFWALASCSPSATGRPTSWLSRGRRPPPTWRPPGPPR